MHIPKRKYVMGIQSVLSIFLISHVTLDKHLSCQLQSIKNANDYHLLSAYYVHYLSEFSHPANSLGFILCL